MANASLYDSTAELDACGIGFVADVRGRASREVLDAVLEALRRVKHRGAVAADGKTGDGAGVLLPIPAALLPSSATGLGMVFLRSESDRSLLATSCCKESRRRKDERRRPSIPPQDDGDDNKPRARVVASAPDK